VYFPAVDKSAEELAAEKEANIQRIAYASKAYLDAQIDADGMLLVDRLLRRGHQYGVENDAWGINLRLEQYNRMAQVDAGLPFTDDMCDFSAFGNKPWTVPQMMMAYLGG